MDDKEWNSGNHSTPAKDTSVSGDPPAEKERARVVIADDDPIIIEPLASLLETGFEVVGRARNGRELLEMVKRLTPAVVVADIAMPEMNGIDAARQITQTYCKVKVVMLSGYSDQDLVEAAFEAGATGYVLKLRAFTDLIPAIHNVLAGQPYCPSDGRAASMNPGLIPE
jgi:DNA-binding NarL/FixJ family response regulator